MPSPVIASPPRIPPSIVITVPSSVQYPWFHNINSNQDFSLNASTKTPRRPTIQVVDSDIHSFKLTTQKRVEVGRHPSFNDGRESLYLDGADSLEPGIIRNRPIRSHRVHQRAFHNDQPYIRPSLHSSPTLKTPNLPLELPPPTSPSRVRRSRPLRHTWLHDFYSRLKISRLCSLPTYYLTLYFAFNLGITLYNKSVLIQFPFPYTLSAVHALCGSIGTRILVRTKASRFPDLNVRDTIILLAFSILYTINIIVSNVSLGLVTVPFHQVVRASTPFFTILFSSILFGVKSSRAKFGALIPVVVGVGFATYGDYYFTPWGFFLTLLGTVLAALKTIFTNVLQCPSSAIQTSSFTANPKVRSNVSHLSIRNVSTSQAFGVSSRMNLPSLTPLHLLYLLSPLAFVQTTVLAYYSGELGRVRHFFAAEFEGPGFGRHTWIQYSIVLGLANRQFWLLFMNGVMAFGLNVVSFSANRKVGALSMTVAANIKQVLTILFAVFLFQLTITPTNAVGIILTLVGGAFYAVVEWRERREKIAR